VKLWSGLGWKAILDQVEAIALLVVCAVWFFLNLDGALGADEVLKTSGTRFMLFGGQVANLNHPPLAKILIGIGPVFLGETSVGWRVVTPFFALGTIYLTYRVGVLLRDRTTGLIASVAVASTHLFASHAVLAMLDIYLAFFVVLLLFLVLTYLRKTGMPEKEEMLYLLAIGAASCAAFLSKYYGIFFAVAAYLVLLWRWRRESSVERDGLSMLVRHRFYLLGFGLVALIAYLPMLIRIQDVIPNFGETGEFVSEIVIGNRILVAGTVYDGAPFWSFFWWLWEFGGWFYLLGLVALLYVLFAGIRNRRLTWENKALIAMGLIPLVCLTLVAVKFPRYLIPLFPILGLSSAMAIRDGMEFIVGLVSARRALSPGPSKLLSVGLALSVLLIPLSPIYTAAEDPQINTDTGYDVAASMVSQYAEANSNRSVLVYSWYSHILEYYLGDSYPTNLVVERLTYSSDQYDEISNGSVDVVVDLEEQPRFEDRPAFTLIHEDYVDRQRAKGDLYLYFMK
jgi:4-amino-4-deoxy-L-arabinose transferase-like glycosyltransferase